MASSKDYLQFVLEQLSELQEITYRAILKNFHMRQLPNRRCRPLCRLPLIMGCLRLI